MNKFRLLRADEIECRISSISEKGLSLLLYKTARTDANLLDETVGAENWQNDFKMVDGVLYGCISIREGNRWIEKWDAGTESNTEAEKGRASDAFKRAGFKWGIGRELYTSPFIFISNSNCEIKKNDKGRLYCNDRFRVVEIAYNDKSEISSLIIANDSKGVDVFSFPRYAQKQPEISRKAQDVKVPTAEQPQPQTAMKQPAEAPDGYFYCDKCGEVIREIKMKNSNAIISQKDAAALSIGKYGRQLCLKCAKDESKAS